ncbi:MAG: FG-GAP-like repeat-containing protein, partial [Planctomycetota bacterium]
DPNITNEAYGPPNLVDLDHDGHEEVVVMGGFTRNVQGRDGARGSVFVEMLSVAEGSGAFRWQVEDDFVGFSIPAVGDLDGDGDLDIVAIGSNNLKRYEADGTPFPGWQVETLNDIIVYSPVIADIDGNPSNGLEIAACAYVFGPQVPEQVYVWNQDGSLHSAMWPKEIVGTFCNALTVVDLDSDPSNGLEIILGVDYSKDLPVDPGTGFFNTFDVFAWHADGSDVKGWPHHFLREPNLGLVDDRIISGATAGDINGDGDIEIVVGTYGQGDPANGNLFVFHHDGTLDANWPRWAGIAQTPSVFGGTALGDLDGDGLLEIVTASFKGVYVFRANGEMFDGFPRMSTDNFGQPMIADIDGDGKLEIVEASLVDGVFAWQLSTPSPIQQPWPQFRQNPGNTGALPVRTQVPTLGETGWAVAFFLFASVGSVLALRARQTSRVSRS